MELHNILKFILYFLVAWIKNFFKKSDTFMNKVMINILFIKY